MSLQYSQFPKVVFTIEAQEAIMRGNYTAKVVYAAAAKAEKDRKALGYECVAVSQYDILQAANNV